MKIFAILAMLMGCQGLNGIPEARGLSEGKIHLSSNTIAQGDLGLIRVDGRRGETPRIWWMDQEVLMIPDGEGMRWQGFLGVDLNSAPGTYPLLVRPFPEAREKRVMIKVVKKDRGVRRLTLPKKMVDLDAQTLERVKEESKVLNEALDTPASSPMWNGPFLRPVEGEVVGPFGRRSIINDQPRAPHSGVDLKAPQGTPVKAMNRGRVILTADHFFSGKSVVIDHGGGILSMYFHLDKTMVKINDETTKGQTIGLVGATGRATGAHLHLGIRVNGARVDPLSLTELSRGLE
ncbi:MAG: M23 family metallopeptidase [Proteobacteria bacterium]|nr:M23 family metallopeptidase [Pseudomonadota bacterium]